MQANSSACIKWQATQINRTKKKQIKHKVDSVHHVLNTRFDWAPVSLELRLNRQKNKSVAKFLFDVSGKEKMVTGTISIFKREEH